MESLASILLTLIVIALLLAYAQGGIAGAASWLKVKFTGET